MTLIEIMVVITILALLSTVVATSVLKHLKHAKIEKARLDTRQLVSACRMHFVRKGAYPKDLEALSTVHLVDRVQHDPWGNPYVLAVEAEEPVITSFGPDGAAGGGDDISSKDPDS